MSISGFEEEEKVEVERDQKTKEKETHRNETSHAFSTLNSYFSVSGVENSFDPWQSESISNPGQGEKAFVAHRFFSFYASDFNHATRLNRRVRAVSFSLAFFSSSLFPSIFSLFILSSLSLSLSRVLSILTGSLPRLLQPASSAGRKLAAAMNGDGSTEVRSPRSIHHNLSRRENDRLPSFSCLFSLSLTHPLPLFQGMEIVIRAATGPLAQMRHVVGQFPLVRKGSF